LYMPVIFLVHVVPFTGVALSKAERERERKGVGVVRERVGVVGRDLGKGLFLALF
jgi:hypothetical protein